MAGSPEQAGERWAGESPLYCLVPPELAELREVIARDLPGDAPVEVLIDRRRRERRTDAERRRGAGHPPAGIERRLAHHLEGRRFAERRAPLAPVEERPPLPPEARPYAEHLRFVRPHPPSIRDREVARLRALAAEWRKQTAVAGSEAIANLIRSQTEGRDALAAALGTRDARTWEHSAAVVWLALECAEEIGLGGEEITEVHDVALLHDIGKIGVPDAILRKQGPLSDTEWEIMREHPAIGARLIDSVDTLRHLGPAIRAEHERWDGRGYPDGLAGEEIPIASRIVFACDAYHAMVSERPYRKPLSPQAARAELAKNLGSQFWSEAASSLLNVLKHGEPRDRAQVAIPRQPPRSSERERQDESERAAGAARRPEHGRSPVEEAWSPSPPRADRQLFEQAAAQLEEARSAAQRHEAASRAAMARRDALKEALERLLDATRQRHGYAPRVFLARVRADAVLNDDDPPTGGSGARPPMLSYAQSEAAGRRSGKPMERPRGSNREPRPAVPIPPLAAVGDDAAATVERVLATARESLGMDVAYFSEFVEETQVVRGAEGAPDVRAGDAVALSESYCKRMVDGEIPNVVANARADERVRDLPSTAELGIGAYVGVPLRTSDGRLYGSLCCMSREPDPSLASRDVRFMHVLGRLLADQLEREQLEAEATRLRAQAASIDALLTALAARDGYTGDHSSGVVSLARLVAEELGLSESEVLEVEQVARLHDIGKIAIPDSILRAPRALSEEEWAVMRTHPEAGERIVGSLEGLRHLAPAIRAEHERWDGAGYPDGLAGEAIPLASRIVLVVDAYHAMVSDRPYRGALGQEEALEEIRRNSGTQFCPHTAEAFLRVHFRSSLRA